MAQHEPVPWQVLQRDLLLERPPWLRIYQEKVQLPSNRIIDDFYRVVLPEFVSVVAMTETDTFIMVRGYKHGVGRVILSPPAGLMDEGETPLQTGQRELLEETGYEADHWQSLGTFVTDGNRQCGTMHVFTARNARLVRPPSEDDAEVLRVELLSRTQLINALRAGEIGNLAGSSSVALALTLSFDDRAA